MFFGGEYLKTDYYEELSAQAGRIKEMLGSEGEDRKRLKSEGDDWRRSVTDALAEDLLPPFNRRVLMSMIQNLGYIFYEVWRLQPYLSGKDDVSNELAESLEFLKSEIDGFKTETFRGTNLKAAAYRLFALWRNFSYGSWDWQLWDGIEAVGDAILRLADSLDAIGKTA